MCPITSPLPLYTTSLERASVKWMGWESSLQGCNRERGLKLFCVETVFGVHEGVHPGQARAQGQKSEYSQESSLVWSSEEPQEI